MNLKIVLAVSFLVLAIILICSFLSIPQNLYYKVCETEQPPKPLFSNATGDYYMGDHEFLITTKCKWRLNSYF